MRLHNRNISHFVLETEDTFESGLPQMRIVLYCRPLFHDQFQFLQGKVLEQGQMGMILGPPGTGKSATALAFASTVDRDEWTWIHLDNFFDWTCVRFDGNERKSRSFVLEDLEILLQEIDQKRHFVLVDGLNAEDEYNHVAKVCAKWFHANQDRRRLAFVCTMTGRGKSPSKVKHHEVFYVYLWTLEEFCDAVFQDELFHSVSNRLESETMEGEPVSRSEMVETKYYYADGSCRYMFYCYTDHVMAQFSFAVADIGSHPPSVVNRWYALLKSPDGSGHVSPAISVHAAKLIGIKYGTDGINIYMGTQRFASNLSLDGWMHEAAFIASLKNDGVTLEDAFGNNESWSELAVLYTDKIPEYPDDGVWVIPKHWNQGGYDAIMVSETSKLVRFVQLASEHKRSFRIEYFHRWLDRLSKSQHSFKVKNLEILFVVEQSELKDFQISSVTGQGLLEPFGWIKGKEKERVRFVSVR